MKSKWKNILTYGLLLPLAAGSWALALLRSAETAGNEMPVRPIASIPSGSSISATSSPSLILTYNDPFFPKEMKKSTVPGCGKNVSADLKKEARSFDIRSFADGSMSIRLNHQAYEFRKVNGKLKIDTIAIRNIN